MKFQDTCITFLGGLYNIGLCHCLGRVSRNVDRYSQCFVLGTGVELIVRLAIKRSVRAQQKKEKTPPSDCPKFVWSALHKFCFEVHICLSCYPKYTRGGCGGGAPMFTSNPKYTAVAQDYGGSRKFSDYYGTFTVSL